MENPIKMDDLGVPLFLETPIYYIYPFFPSWLAFFLPSNQIPNPVAWLPEVNPASPKTCPRLNLSHRIHGTGIFPYIYHKNQLNVGKYTIHG